jgi:hypothetical protein
MSRTADYFGLIAYMFVMYGGLPVAESLWSDVTAREPAKKARTLRVVTRTDQPKAKRRRAPVAAQDAAA